MPFLFSVVPFGLIFEPRSALLLLIGDPDGVARTDRFRDKHRDVKAPPFIANQIEVGDLAVGGMAVDDALRQLVRGDQVLPQCAVGDAEGCVAFDIPKAEYAVAQLFAKADEPPAE